MYRTKLSNHHIYCLPFRSPLLVMIWLVRGSRIDGAKAEERAAYQIPHIRGCKEIIHHNQSPDRRYLASYVTLLRLILTGAPDFANVPWFSLLTQPPSLSSHLSIIQYRDSTDSATYQEKGKSCHKEIQQAMPMVMSVSHPSG